MHSFTAVIAASALLSAVSGAPHFVRSNTCGSAPTGTSTSNQPLKQLTTCQTAADCQTQCDANTSCQSFCFGLIDNVIQCKLYSVSAASIPKQSSTNLVAYDKACSAVPSVVPTASNPTGKQVDSSSSSSGSKTTEQQGKESQKADSSKTTEQQATESKVTQKVNKKSTTNKQTSANTCGSKPAANTSNQPISTPTVSSEDACKTKCQADSSCKSFTCGEVNNQFVCKLYNVEASKIPAPTTTAQKSALKAYDVGCSM
ncbi:hypothetical protein N0V83_000270 [Neocucurbitaria cava]|uniref:Apple domain-containing protein n=1 Tax=Neocucurbitaria cava TaxID=798079 RepID=A0A9W8YJ29_9PLEO|nr:hypothetical protein N0V83_000270 [Neocucurbitaria cava]